MDHGKGLHKKQEQTGVFFDRQDIVWHFKKYAPFFLLLAAVCSIDRIFFGKFAAIDIYDSVEVHFIHYKSIAALIREFGIFGWYPNIAGGQPVFVSQHPPYALPTLASMLLPLWLVYLLWTLCLQFCSGWGMYRMLREIIGIRDRLALFLASLFAIMMAYGIVHLVYSFVFPMVVVWTFDLFDKSLSRLRRLSVLGALLAFMLTSFPVLTLPHFPVFHFALILYFMRSRPGRVQRLSQVVLVWTAYVLIFSPQIVSLFQYIPMAQRYWHPIDIPFATAFVDFLKAIKGKTETIPTISILLLAVLYTIRCNKLRVPFLFLLVPIILSSFFGSGLKDFLADTFFVKMDLFLSSTVLSVSGIIVVALFMEYLIDAHAKVSLYHIIPVIAIVATFGAEYKIIRHLIVLASAFLAISLLYDSRPFRWLTQKKALYLLPVLFSLLVMLYRQESATAGMYVPYARGFESHSSLAMLREEAKTSPFRVACVDIHPAIAQSYGLETVDLKFPVFNKYYKQYVGKLIEPQFVNQVTQGAFHEVWRQLYLTRLQNDHDQRPLSLETGANHSTSEFNMQMLRAMNVRYFIASKPMVSTDNDITLRTVDPGLSLEVPFAPPALDRYFALPMYIYRLENSADRAFLASSIQIEIDRVGVLRSLAKPDRGSATGAVFAEEDFIKADSPPLEIAHSGQVRIQRYTPDKILLTGNSDTSGIVVVTNNMDPNWHAKVNGVMTSILRVNHAFQAIVVPAGDFVVELRYENVLLWSLHGLSLMGILLMFAPVLAKTKTDQSVVQRQEATCCGPEGGNSALQVVVQTLAAPFIWTVGFYLFEYTSRRATPNSTSYGYILLTTPFIGALMIHWARSFFRRLAR